MSHVERLNLALMACLLIFGHACAPGPGSDRRPVDTRPFDSAARVLPERQASTNSKNDSSASLVQESKLVSCMTSAEYEGLSKIQFDPTLMAPTVSGYAT